MRKSVTLRTSERLIRLAYDMEELAARMIAEGHDSEGNGVRSIASHLGKIGRTLENKLLALRGEL
jgi:hypothetical protein